MIHYAHLNHQAITPQKTMDGVFTKQEPVRTVSPPTFAAKLDDALPRTGEESIMKGGIACPFPWKLHEMLDYVVEEGLEHIVSWRPHGRAFRVHKPKEFTELIMPRFFAQTKYASFLRQLNLYGFSRFTIGKDKGSYYHLCFIRNKPKAVRGMARRKIKGKKTFVQRMLSPLDEPDFYSLEYTTSEVESVKGPSKKIDHSSYPRGEHEAHIPRGFNYNGRDKIHVPSSNELMDEPVEPSIFDLDLEPLPLAMDNHREVDMSNDGTPLFGIKTYQMVVPLRSWSNSGINGNLSNVPFSSDMHYAQPTHNCYPMNCRSSGGF